MKTIKQIQNIINHNKPVLKDIYKVKKLELFGSYVRGEEKETSDLDILAEFSEPVSLLDIVGLENYLSDILNIDVDIVPKQNIRKELKATILKEAIPV